MLRFVLYYTYSFDLSTIVNYHIGTKLNNRFFCHRLVGAYTFLFLIKTIQKKKNVSLKSTLICKK